MFSTSDFPHHEGGEEGAFPPQVNEVAEEGHAARPKPLRGWEAHGAVQTYHKWGTNTPKEELLLRHID